MPRFRYANTCPLAAKIINLSEALVDCGFSVMYATATDWLSQRDDRRERDREKERGRGSKEKDEAI